MQSIAPWNNGLNVVREYMPRKAIDENKACSILFATFVNRFCYKCYPFVLQAKSFKYIENTMFK